MCSFPVRQQEEQNDRAAEEEEEEEQENNSCSDGAAGVGRTLPPVCPGKEQKRRKTWAEKSRINGLFTSLNYKSYQ